MGIPGFLLNLLTFPGVMVHEMAHLAFCRLLAVPVYRVCYFRFGNPAGYVVHGVPSQPWHHLLIGIGPFIINSAAGCALGLWQVTRGGQPPRWQAIVIYWLAIAIAMHAFPSTGDARSIWRAAWSRGTGILVKLLSLPLVAFIYLLALGSVVWLDLAYGVVVAAVLPRLLLEWLQ